MGGIYWFVFIKNLQPDEAYGALYLRRVFRCPFLHLGYGVDALNRAFMENTLSDFYLLYHQVVSIAFVTLQRTYQ